MLIRHPDSARGNDLYETPEVATLALLRAEPLPRTIWEPACGPGAIVRVLRDAGHRVIATDLIDYRSPDRDHAGRDFLLERRAPDGVEMIVTNPPFKLAAQFAAHALSLCPRVAMPRLSFLESGNEKRRPDGRNYCPRWRPLQTPNESARLWQSIASLNRADVTPDDVARPFVRPDKENCKCQRTKRKSIR